MTMTKPTICWDCKNAYADKCDWIGLGVPVPDWKAKDTTVLYVGMPVDTYRVDKCPDFVRENRKGDIKVCGFCGKEFEANTEQRRYCNDYCQHGARLRWRKKGVTTNV